MARKNNNDNKINNNNNNIKNETLAMLQALQEVFLNWQFTDGNNSIPIFLPKNSLPEPDKNSGIWQMQAFLMEACGQQAVEMLSKEEDDEITVISVRELLSLMEDNEDILITLRRKNPIFVSHKEKVQNPVLEKIKQRKEHEQKMNEEFQKEYERRIAEYQQQNSPSSSSSDEVPF